MAVVVAVAGKFDPIHRGHMEHIRFAKGLGDILVVITHPDEVIKKLKGYCLLPLEDRIAVLRDNRYVDSVIISIDGDGGVAETLKYLKPQIFAKGGDRTPDNMPEKELDVCNKLGIQIIYGVGGQWQSSSKLVERMNENLNL